MSLHLTLNPTVGYILTRLTEEKNSGNTITVAGKEIALGIPGRGKDQGPTGMAEIPLGRPGTADEAAAPIVFLCSKMASYISGHTIEVTGGESFCAFQ